jgi:DNA-binding transcriptional ArsR family regulator
MTSDPIDIPASVALLRVLANPARLRIALRLFVSECSVAAMEAQLGIRQPTLSQHLADLRDAGLVATRRESRAVFYRLTGARERQLIAAVLGGFGAENLQATQLTPRPQSVRQAAVFASARLRS